MIRVRYVSDKKKCAWTKEFLDNDLESAIMVAGSMINIPNEKKEVEESLSLHGRYSVVNGAEWVEIFKPIEGR